MKVHLGAGGMGVVYLSFTRGGILLAVKFMKEELAGDPGFRRQIKNEMAAARRVHSLYTALVLDAR